MSAENQVEPEKVAPAPATAKDYFSTSKMMKFAEEAGIFNKEDAPKSAPAKEVKTETKKDSKPCPNCPPETKTKAPEERKPYRVLKVDGKDWPVYSEKELDELALKGVDSGTKSKRDAEVERDLVERERKMEEVSAPLQKLVSMIESGKLPNVSAAAPVSEAAGAEELDLEEVHPAVRKKLEEQEKVIKSLSAKMSVSEQRESVAQLEQAKQKLTEFVDESRKNHPFDEYVDPESGSNVTQDLFAGMLSVIINRDVLKQAQDKSHRLKPMQDYVEQTAKAMSAYHGWAKGDGSGVASKATADGLTKQYPEQVKEIRQQAIAEYLKDQGEMPPTLKSTGSEPKREKAEKKKMGSFDDYVKAAKEDDELNAAFEEAGRKYRATA